MKKSTKELRGLRDGCALQKAFHVITVKQLLGCDVEQQSSTGNASSPTGQVAVSGDHIGCHDCGRVEKCYKQVLRRG